MLTIKLPKEEKELLIDDVIRYFEEERSETIGRLAAEACLDHMIGLIGPAVYNQALKDARSLVSERMNGLEDDLYALEKRRMR